MRTYDAAGTAVLRAAGAAPARISSADAGSRLRAGELDAVLSFRRRQRRRAPVGGAAVRHGAGLRLSPEPRLCSTAALDALPGPAREAVAQAARETEARQFAAIGTRLAENEARMRANGVEVASAPPALRAALARASEPVVAEWVARAGPGEAALAAYRTRYTNGPRL